MTNVTQLSYIQPGKKFTVGCKFCWLGWCDLEWRFRIHTYTVCCLWLTDSWKWWARKPPSNSVTWRTDTISSNRKYACSCCLLTWGFLCGVTDGLAILDKYKYLLYPGMVWSIVMMVSVCQSTPARISQKPHDWTSHNFLSVFRVAVARSLSASLWYVMYFQFVDDVIFSHSSPNAHRMYSIPNQLVDDVTVETPTLILNNFFQQ